MGLTREAFRDHVAAFARQHTGRGRVIVWAPDAAEAERFRGLLRGARGFYWHVVVSRVMPRSGAEFFLLWQTFRTVDDMLASGETHP